MENILFEQAACSIVRQDDVCYLVTENNVNSKTYRVLPSGLNIHAEPNGQVNISAGENLTSFNLSI